MRLQFLRTANPEKAGGPWMVVDEDQKPIAEFAPVFVGTAEQCGRFVDVAEHPVYAPLSTEAKMTLARSAAVELPNRAV